MNVQRTTMTYRSQRGFRQLAGHARWVAATACLALLASCGGEPAGPPVIPATQVTAVDTPPPQYPIEVACRGIGGTVGLSVTIGLDGKPSKILVTSPHQALALNAAATEAVRGWQFNAATRNGQPVETTIQVPVTFNPPTVRPQRCFALDDTAS